MCFESGYFICKRCQKDRDYSQAIRASNDGRFRSVWAERECDTWEDGDEGDGEHQLLDTHICGTWWFFF
jgi:hypothetical protein